MKATCVNQQCRQRVEYSDEHRGTAIPCPACGIPIFFPKKTIWSVIGRFIPITKFLEIYFDSRAVMPPISSPYGTVIQTIRGLYCLLVGVLLFSFLFGIILWITTPVPDIFLSLFTGMFILSWIIIHVAYKIVVVIFDIAEYLRQLNDKILK